MKLQTEIFEKFDKGWPILTAGDKDVFDQAGTFENDDYKTENLIKEKGRLLYEAADERQSRPWQSVADMDYDKLCSLADIMGV